MARRAVLIVSCALAISAGAFRLTAPPGPGLDPDALSYLGAAESMVAHGTYRIPVAPWYSDSLTQPLAHFPPGFATTIAAPMTLGVDARLAARLVEALSAGAAAALLMLALWPAAGAWGATLGALAVVLTPHWVTVHLSVLSEPLFLAFVTLLLWSMTRHRRASALHGVIAALATMVRYAGLSLAGAAALWALLDKRATWRARIARAATAVAPSLIAMALWTATRAHAPGKAAPIRKFAVYGDWAPTLNEGARTIGHLLAPSMEWNPVPWLAAIGTAIAMAALVWSGQRTGFEESPTPLQDDVRFDAQRELSRAAGVIALAYVGLIFASRLLADPAIPFDFRLAVPLVPLLMAWVACVAARAWTMISKPSKVFGVLAFTVWCVAAVIANEEQVTYALTEGSDFASTEWRNSPTLDWARTQGADRALFTNWPCAIWFHQHRNVRDLPNALDAATMTSFVAHLRKQNGVVVAWNVQSPETANADSLVARAGLVRVATFDDGAIYEAPPLVAIAPAAVAPPTTKK